MRSPVSPPADAPARASAGCPLGLAVPRVAPLAVLPLLLGVSPALGQSATGDPFPEPLGTGEDPIVVDVVEFASVPDADGAPARLMKMVHEPGTDRLFVNGQRGPLYIVSPDGSEVALYVDIDDPKWGVGVQSSGRERGFQSFAFHPQFGQPGTPGHGKFYTWTDVRDVEPEPDFVPGGGNDSHDTVLLEWTAVDPTGARYDGEPPRELMRFEQPFGNHNGGDIDFDPLAGPGDPDFGLLYVGSADGGAGGDPFDLAGNPGSAFGKILRIDPLGSDGRNGEYGIPDENPFAGDGDPSTLDEIYAVGVRNPQHLAWDPETGRAFVADIGQNTVEEVSLLERGADLGWNEWEGSFRFVGRGGVDPSGARSDPDVTYPVAEYDQEDPLFGNRVAVSGLVVYRHGAVSALTGRLLFGDLPGGEILHVDADELPEGGQDAVGRVLLRSGDGEPRRLLDLVREKNREQGREAADRVDLRMSVGPEGRIFLLNKHDGTIRTIVPADR